MPGGGGGMKSASSISSSSLSSRRSKRRPQQNQGNQPFLPLSKVRFTALFAGMTPFPACSSRLSGPIKAAAVDEASGAKRLKSDC